MRSFLGNIWDIYAELWQEIPVIGYPWLVFATIVPVVPVILVAYELFGDKE